MSESKRLARTQTFTALLLATAVVGCASAPQAYPSGHLPGFDALPAPCVVLREPRGDGLWNEATYLDADPDPNVSEYLVLRYSLLRDRMVLERRESYRSELGRTALLAELDDGSAGLAAEWHHRDDGSLARFELAGRGKLLADSPYGNEVDPFWSRTELDACGRILSRVGIVGPEDYWTENRYERPATEPGTDEATAPSGEAVTTEASGACDDRLAHALIGYVDLNRHEAAVSYRYDGDTLVGWVVDRWDNNDPRSRTVYTLGEGSAGRYDEDFDGDGVADNSGDLDSLFGAPRSFANVDVAALRANTDFIVLLPTEPRTRLVPLFAPFLDGWRALRYVDATGEEVEGPSEHVFVDVGLEGFHDWELVLERTADGEPSVLRFHNRQSEHPVNEEWHFACPTERVRAARWMPYATVVRAPERPFPPADAVISPAPATGALP